eukprot:5211960-Pleurochrysis_carterae.AAC.3
MRAEMLTRNPSHSRDGREGNTHMSTRYRMNRQDPASIQLIAGNCFTRTTSASCSRLVASSKQFLVKIQHAIGRASPD